MVEVSYTVFGVLVGGIAIETAALLFVSIQLREWIRRSARLRDVIHDVADAKCDLYRDHDNKVKAREADKHTPMGFHNK